MNTPSQSKCPDHPEDKDTCTPECAPIAMERNRFFTGKYMTARDFQADQDYFLSRHRLHNRLLHGWGIVCGLEVYPHPNPACPDHVLVTPGIAIDCCGREIVLNHQIVVKVQGAEEGNEEAQQASKKAEERGKGEKSEQTANSDEEAEEAYQAASQKRPTQQGKPPARTRWPYLLYAHYCEEQIELVPALYSENACDPKRSEANRVRETACVEVILWDEAHRRDEDKKGCWPLAQPDEVKRRCVDDCKPKPDTDAPGCIDPDCPCGLGVALALVHPRVGPKGYLIGENDILKDGRRELQTPESVLTHIVDYNWPHGGSVKLSELRDPDGMDGKLKIYFDRKLKDFPPENLAVGINEFTFRVECHRKKDVEYELAALYSDQNPPHLEDNQCVAVFPIDDDLLTGRKTIGDCDLYIRLMCDFIPDCHDRLVDGEHRKGQTPTGDGKPGGVFESWFRVIEDEGGKRSR